MSIAILFAACLLADPEPEGSASILGASELGRASVRAFDAAVLAVADPSVDPAASTYTRDGSDAAAFSYDWVEMGYAVTQIHDISNHTDGFYWRGSIAFLDYFHVLAGIVREETSFDDATLDTYEIGGGVHLSVLPKLDVLGEASWLYNKIDSENLFSSDNNTGVSLYAGARFMVLDWSGGGLEADGGFRYTDINSLLSAKTTRSWEAGARAHFVNHISVGATYAYIEADQRFLFDVRFSF